MISNKVHFVKQVDEIGDIFKHRQCSCVICIHQGLKPVYPIQLDCVCILFLVITSLSPGKFLKALYSHIESKKSRKLCS